jgi:hypothetical protein
VELVSLLVALAYTAAVIVFVMRYCYFYGDDFSGFLLSRTDRLASYVIYPVGGQVVPLARLLNMAFFSVAGLSYGAAVITLLLLHLVGIVYLYRTLALLGRSPLNAVLTALYACYIYTWVQLGWWIAGLERMPFMALSAMAVFHSVRHEQAGRRSDLVAASILTVLALGFYSKAVLLPVALVGLDVARIPLQSLRARARFFAVRWITAAGVFVVMMLSWVLEHRGSGVPLGATSSTALSDFMKFGLLSYAHGAFVTYVGAESHSPRPAVGLLWLALVAYTCYRSPRAAVAWLILFGLVFSNLLVIGVSSRAVLFGPSLAFEIRYYWELWFFSILFVGVILKQLPATTPEARWVLSAPKGATQGIVAVLLVSYALLAYREFSTATLWQAAPFTKTRAFVATLREDLKRLNSPDAPLKLTDDNLPPYVFGLDLTATQQSQLLFLMKERVMYSLPGKADYRITPSGHIVRISEKARPAR